MKGIILAGESGHRLNPLTLGVPKQLLPVYDKPMVFYPINTLKAAGIQEVLIITTTKHQQLFKEYLLGIKEVSFQYACQDTPNGIAAAISIGSYFIGNDDVCLITGDTIIVGNNFNCQFRKAIRAAQKSANATIFVSDEHDVEQYGIVTYDYSTGLNKIEGKSDHYHVQSITGIYVYPNRVVKCIEKIQPSERGLLEIIAIHKLFQADAKLQIQKLDKECSWFAPSNFDDLITVNNYFYKQKHNKL